VARYHDAVCRLCRREGTKLYLKGERCLGPKCAVERQNYPPGQHGQSRRKLSTYGLQLREKQKAKRIYGVLERQFRRYFEIAERYRSVTGTVLLQLLERRLDSVLYRMGVATSRAAARQIVRHGHVRVNGKKVDIPSYLVKVGEELTLSEKTRSNAHVKAALEQAEKRERVPWVEFSSETLAGKIIAIPEREDIPVNIKEQMIVELYSK
jgi:small subunit ribosomal protein S4